MSYDYRLRKLLKANHMPESLLPQFKEIVERWLNYERLGIPEPEWEQLWGQENETIT